MKIFIFHLLTVFGVALGQTITIQTNLPPDPMCDETVLSRIYDLWMQYKGPEPQTMRDLIQAKIDHLIGATGGVLPGNVQCAFSENFFDKRVLRHKIKGSDKPAVRIPIIMAECGTVLYYPIIGRYVIPLPPVGDLRAAYNCNTEGAKSNKHNGVIYALSSNYTDADINKAKEWLSYCEIKVKDYPYDCPLE